LLSQIGLSSADYERFVTATRFVRDDLDNIENERKLARNKGQAAIVATALRLRRDAILENAVDNMLASLEPVGRTAFYTFIQVHVKPRIVIYDLPSAASHH
jgi:phosphoenolpyruvate-protein kinase (PTS system EI component)